MFSMVPSRPRTLDVEGPVKFEFSNVSSADVQGFVFMLMNAQAVQCNLHWTANLVESSAFMILMREQRVF